MMSIGFVYFTKSRVFLMSGFRIVGSVISNLVKLLGLIDICIGCPRGSVRKLEWGGPRLTFDFESAKVKLPLLFPAPAGACLVEEVGD